MSSFPVEKLESEWGGIRSLIERVLADDAAAVAALVEMVRSIARPTANRSIGSSEDLSEVVQESTLKVWRKLESFEGATLQEFRAWIESITTRTCVDWRRFEGRQKRAAGRTTALPQDSRGGAALAYDTATPSRKAANNEQAAQFEQALLQLSEDEQHVIRMKVHECRSWDEISAQLDKSVAAARQCYYRAIRKLERDRGDDSQPN